MKYIFFLIIILEISCSSSKIIKKSNEKKEIKVLATAILIAKKNNYKFKPRTKYQIYFLDWNTHVKLRCTRRVKGKNILIKGCVFSKKEEWENKFQRILKVKSKNFWYVKISTPCIDTWDFMNDGSRRYSSNYNTFFIEEKTLSVFYYFNNNDFECKNNL